MEYLVAKLVSGETIVALSGDAGNDHIQMVYPFEVYKEQTFEDEFMITTTKLRPYLPYSEEQILVLQTQHIIYITPLKEDLAQVYKNMVDAMEAVESEQPVPREDVLSFHVDPVDTIQ